MLKSGASHIFNHKLLLNIKNDEKKINFLFKSFFKIFKILPYY